MKIPKKVRLYCKKCKKHSEFKLKEFKAGSPSSLKRRQRGFERKHKKGYGGKAKFPIKPKKQAKKPTYLAQCTVCNAKTYYVIPKRMKKKELVA